MPERSPYAWPDAWRQNPGYVDLFRRLAWLYGPERAEAIAAGVDPATNADIESWRRVGRRV